MEAAAGSLFLRPPTRARPQHPSAWLRSPPGREGVGKPGWGKGCGPGKDWKAPEAWSAQPRRDRPPAALLGGLGLEVDPTADVNPEDTVSPLRRDPTPVHTAEDTGPAGQDPSLLAG